MSAVAGQAREVDAESVLRQLGQAGRFHLRAYVLLALVAVQVGLLHTTYIFLAATVPYRYVPTHHILFRATLVVPVTLVVNVSHQRIVCVLICLVCVMLGRIFPV